MPRRLILAGIMGRYPVGGVTWCALHYIAAFQALGFEVFYLEDTGECGFDPVSNSSSTDPAYGLAYVKRHLRFVGLDDAWTYVEYKGRYQGRSRADVAAFCARADMMVNLSGGYWPRAEPGSNDATRSFPPEYERLTKIFIDTDPGFTQLAINRAGPGWYRSFFTAHDGLFTFALKWDPRAAASPRRRSGGIRRCSRSPWSFGPSPPCPEDAPYTAIMSWRTDSFREFAKDKAVSLYKMIDLPSKLPRRALLAIAGQYPPELLARHN